jgi:hypothetical protein
MLHIDPLTQALFAKPFAAGAVAGAIDRFYFDKPSLKGNALVGAAVAAGILAADVGMKLGDKASHHVEKSIETRILELGASSAATLGIERFVLGRYTPPNQMPEKLAAIVISEMAGEWIVSSFAMPGMI